MDRDQALLVPQLAQLREAVGDRLPARLVDEEHEEVDDGLLERVCYQERPARYEYRPTDKARDLLTALLGLMHWGDEHAAHPAGPPRIANHVGCGGDVREQLVCTHCGHVVGPDAVDLLPGPALTDQPA